MPTFLLWPTGGGPQDCLWVYAVDDWDARDQIGAALGVAAHDEAAYKCIEDERRKVPLSVIVHGSGDRTAVPEPVFVETILPDCTPFC